MIFHRNGNALRSVELIVLSGLLTLFCSGCPRSGSGGSGNTTEGPAQNSKDYEAAVDLHNSCTLAIEAGDNNSAVKYCEALTKAAPGEAAAWANLAIVKVRTGQIPVAVTSITKAISLDPKSAPIYVVQSAVLSRNGDSQGSINALKEAQKLDPKNAFVLANLAQALERSNTPADLQAAVKSVSEALDSLPRNLFLNSYLLRLGCKTNDKTAINKALTALSANTVSWPEVAVSRLKSIQGLIASNNLSSAGNNATLLSNVLQTVPQWGPDYNAVQSVPGNVAAPVQKTSLLKLPERVVAYPYEQLTLSPEAPLKDKAEALRFETLVPAVNSEVAKKHSTAELTVKATEESKPSLISVLGKTATISGPVNGTLPFPGGAKQASRHSILIADLNYDFLPDIVFASSGGLKLYQQTQQHTFVDVTAKTKLPASILNGKYNGVWMSDIDMDGDLDLILGVDGGATIVLRNNGDGTYTPNKLFASVIDLKDSAFLDIDGDGDVDAALLDGKGNLHVFINERLGLFVEKKLTNAIGELAALAVADVDNDGILDVVAISKVGRIFNISSNSQNNIEFSDIAKWEGTVDFLPGVSAIFAEDIDNNGATDLIVTDGKTTRLFLNYGKGKIQQRPAIIPGNAMTVADLRGKGGLGILTIEKDHPLWYVDKNDPTYHWQVIQTRSDRVARGADPTKNGNKRINSFGVGGEIEVRAGALASKLPIKSSSVHVGLGSRRTPDFMRLIWPNGIVNAEFEHKVDTAEIAEQRLIGSCPWLFAWNGKSMEFVTDYLWRSPLGLRINEQASAGVMTTEDWVKISGDQLKPKDGFYDLRITAELWETHFFDYLGLMVVDHPAGTEAIIDERFAFPPPKFRVYVTSRLQPVQKATDDSGNDVTGIISKQDGSYLDNFGRGEYQGITRDHFVELELPANLPADKPNYLVCYGWIHPTDSSINVAISQGNHAHPKPLVMSVQEPNGKWRVVNDKIGFPSGKNKTILIPLSGIFKSGVKPKVRLATNMEIYWDQIAWTSELTNLKPTTTTIPLSTASLQYRGYSNILQTNASSPELPEYSNIARVGPRWRDLIGFCTRFGDVKELLTGVDDRYVIMNAGDEMLLKFKELPAPKSGMVRDYVLVGDGWEKDGNYNTTFSKTVLPLPSHDNPNYNVKPTTLEADPVYKRHKSDWFNYHTRYVTPQNFVNVMGFSRNSSEQTK